MSVSGKAVIFCAPSGAGKTTIVKHLISNIPALKFSISATTRKPRQGEIHGKDYYFLSEEEFKLKINNNELYEWQEVYAGMYYGTLKAEVERIWFEGNHVIFDVDVIGGLNLKKELKGRALAVFVSVKNTGVLEERLRARNTETEETLQIRISKSVEEMSYANKFDSILINNELSDAFSDAHQIVSDFIFSK
jgi:guanylate kinase